MHHSATAAVPEKHSARGPPGAMYAGVPASGLAVCRVISAILDSPKSCPQHNHHYPRSRPYRKNLLLCTSDASARAPALVACTYRELDDGSVRLRVANEHIGRFLV